MTFKELAIGERFKFHPGVWTFSSDCTKISARKYTWVNGDKVVTSRIGNIKAGVKQIDRFEAAV